MLLNFVDNVKNAKRIEQPTHYPLSIIKVIAACIWKDPYYQLTTVKTTYKGLFWSVIAFFLDSDLEYGILTHFLDADPMTCNGSEELNPDQQQMALGNLTIIKDPDQETKVVVEFNTFVFLISLRCLTFSFKKITRFGTIIVYICLGCKCDLWWTQYWYKLRWYQHLLLLEDTKNRMWLPEEGDTCWRECWNRKHVFLHDLV